MHMKRILLIPVLLFSNFIFANEYWKQDYSKIDSFAYTIKPTVSLVKLAGQLTEPYSTEAEKYRSIFAWITHNIAYDLEALKNPAVRVTEPVGVIRRKKTVCQGYSNLFLSLCTAANLECVYISGWTHNELKIGKPLAAKTTHSWNAIKIKDEWYLCDVTWAAGYTTDNPSAFIFQYKEHYFCTPPELFFYDHFPQEAKWLLGVQSSREDFINQPNFYSEAIKINLKELKPGNGMQIYKKNKTISFSFSTDVAVKSILICPSNVKISTPVKFTQENNVTTFEYTLNAFSPYLYIYLNHQGVLAYKITPE